MIRERIDTRPQSAVCHDCTITRDHCDRHDMKSLCVDQISPTSTGMLCHEFCMMNRLMIALSSKAV